MKIKEINDQRNLFNSKNKKWQMKVYINPILYFVTIKKKMKNK